MSEVGSIKARQMEAWRAAFASEASDLASRPFFTEALGAYLAALPQKALAGKLAIELDLASSHAKATGIRIADADGLLLLAGGKDRGADFDSEGLACARAARASGHPEIRDLFYSTALGYRIEVYSPIAFRDGRVVFLCMSRDPAQDLYPLVMSWPRQSGSAEALIVRRDGESVLFLSPVRKAGNPPLSLRIPLSKRDVPSVRAVLGQGGSFVGRDYRDVKVFSDIEHIAGSPWALVVKVDSDEMLRPLRLRILALMAISAAIALLVLVGTAYLVSRREKTLYRHLFSDSIVPALIVDPENGDIWDANEAAASLYGRDTRALSRLRYHDFLYAEEGEGVPGFDLLKGAMGTHFPARQKAADGSALDVEMYSNGVRIGGRDLLHCLVIEQGPRLRAERAQSALLAEKEVLLRELHHRTKNNLQIVSSLLGLTFNGFSDPAVSAAVGEMQGRIATIALSHEKLYRAPDVARIDLGAYIAELGRLILSSEEAGQRVAFESETEALPVTVETASPCGLVINELITNSLKHAFPGGGHGLIRIELSRGDANLVFLRYRDDGVGLPAGFDAERASTLGLSLISSIVLGQLGGKLAYGEGPGFSCGIEFAAIA